MSSATPPQRSVNNGPQPCLVISVHDSHILKLEYLPDGRSVIIQSDDGAVQFWNLEDGEEEGTSIRYDSGNGIGDVAVTRDGTKIVISSDEDGKIRVWDVESHKLVREWAHPENTPTDIVAISPDGRLIAAAGFSSVAIYTMEGRQVGHSIEVGKRIWSMSFSPDGKKFACCTPDAIRVYDVDNGTLISEGHQRRVECVLWSHDGNRLFSGSNDETIRCWNSDTGEQIGRSWTGHTGFIRSLSLSPDGLILASASWDETVCLWEATTGSPIGQHLQHDESVNVVRFSPSGEFVASAGWDGKIYLWRVPWLNFITHHQVIASFGCVLTPALIFCRFSLSHLELPLTYVTMKSVHTLLSVSPSSLLYPFILVNNSVILIPCRT